jgi:hypothetical protein
MTKEMSRIEDETPLAPRSSCDRWFIDPTIKEVCRKTRGKSHLSKDEILLLSLAAGQAAFARHVEPDSAHDAEETLEDIGRLLDNDAIAEATHEKARELLAKREGTYLDASQTPVNPTLGDVLNALYDSEINAQVSVESFWDGGWHWTLKLGDELNGFRAEKDFTPKEFREQAAIWLIKEACKQYPESLFKKQYAQHLHEEAKAE